MKDVHMSPADAVQARLCIAMHFGTFPLTAEGIDEPRAGLRNALRANVPEPHFRAPDIGETLWLEAL